MLLTTKTSALDWVRGISLHLRSRWSQFVKTQTGSESNFRRVFGGVECRVFHTTFSIASRLRTLKCLPLRRTGGDPVIGWDDFNWSFQRMTEPTAEFQR